MKQRLIGGVVVMTGLLAAYLMMREPPQETVRSPLTLPAVAEIARVEVVPAGAKDRLVMERREDGWWLTKPVEAKLLEGKVREIEGAFSRAIRTDDLKIAESKAADYRVTEEAATRVQVFPKGAADPAIDLLVGKRIKVPSTKAERTFVRVPGKPKIHRLQASLAFLHDRDASAWRTKQIVMADAKAATSVVLERAGGQAIELVKQGESWEMKRPVAGMALEEASVTALVSSALMLVASGFPKKAPEALGLNPPQVKLTVGVGEATRVVHLGEVEGKFYAQVPGRADVYEITGYTGRRVMPGVLGLKRLVPREIPRAEITSVAFAGEGVTLVKRGDAWEMTAPKKAKELDPTQLEATWTFLEKLRVARYVTPEPGKQGLEGSTERVVIGTKGGTKHVLVLGSVFGEKKERYAKFEGAPEVFVLPKNIAKRLGPRVEDVVAKKAG